MSPGPQPGLTSPQWIHLTADTVVTAALWERMREVMDRHIAELLGRPPYWAGLLEHLTVSTPPTPAALCGHRPAEPGYALRVRPGAYWGDMPTTGEAVRFLAGWSERTGPFHVESPAHPRL